MTDVIYSSLSNLVNENNGYSQTRGHIRRGLQLPFKTCKIVWKKKTLASVFFIERSTGCIYLKMNWSHTFCMSEKGLLTLCMLGNFACFFVVCGFFNTCSKNSFRNTVSVSNSLDPDQARRFVGPDLGPNCLQRLSADDKSRH